MRNERPTAPTAPTAPAVSAVGLDGLPGPAPLTGPAPLSGPAPFPGLDGLSGPDPLPWLDPDTGRRMARALRFLQAEALAQPRLADVARHVHLSEHHFQRLFKRWVGISPKRYLQVLTAGHAAALLRGQASTLEAAYASGLSSPSRLHELFVALHAVTPGELKRGGADLVIRWGVQDTPLGPALLAATPLGLCALGFVQPAAPESLVDRLRADWPQATLRQDPAQVAPFVERVFGPRSRLQGSDRPLTLHVRGTNFQTKVWEALLALPPGQLTTYGELAARLGCPRGARAVGQAVGANPVAWIIPCHRVIRESGQLGGYRYGLERKRAMLTLETVQPLVVQ